MAGGTGDTVRMEGAAHWVGTVLIPAIAAQFDMCGGHRLVRGADALMDWKSADAQRP